MSVEMECWKVTIGFKDMDMSGGWLDADSTINVVAKTKELAGAAAMSTFYDHQNATVKKVNKICDVHLVVDVKGDNS